MTKYISLFGATTTDTQVQVVKENQVIIGIGAGASRKRYVVYKVEHTARGYVYHMVDTETKEISQTDILRPLSQTFGIGRYYDDVNPEFMDAFEVALLVRQAEEQATAQAIAAAKEKAEHDRIAEIGAQRLRRIMPEGVQGVIIAELNETEYTDPSYECSTTRSVRTVILGFSATSRNGFGELRKAAANFPQTAHLSEYDPKNEHRYPVFTLGKSPKYGWSVCKLTHYTREGYIDRLAYIAGNEENICLPHHLSPYRLTLYIGRCGRGDSGTHREHDTLSPFRGIREQDGYRISLPPKRGQRKDRRPPRAASHREPPFRTGCRPPHRL